MNIVPKRFYFEDIFDDFLPPTTLNNILKCDIYEKDSGYHIEIDIPGFDKNDITIEVKNGYLTVSGEKNAGNNKDDKNYIKRERIYSKFKRSFYVGEINSEEVKAKFDNGTLRVSFPKAKPEQKIIEIED